MSQSAHPARPYALSSGEGWTYRYGIDFTVKSGELQPGRGAAVVEYATRRGEEPPPHAHPTEDEMFYVLEGAVTFRCAGEAFDLSAGGFIFLPRGMEHAYAVAGEGPVRLLAITAPAREGALPGWGGFAADIERAEGGLVAGPAGRSSAG